MLFAQLLIVRVPAELAAELAKVAVHVDAVVAIGADKPFFMDCAQQCKVG